MTAKDHKTAIDAAIEHFKLAQWQVARLVVTVRTRSVYGVKTAADAAAFHARFGRTAAGRATAGAAAEAGRVNFA